MLTAKNGATMETDLEETPNGWVARYLIVSAELGKFKPTAAGVPDQGRCRSLALGGGDRPRLRLRDGGLEIRRGGLAMAGKLEEELDQLSDQEIEARLAAAVWVDDKRAGVLRYLEEKKLGRKKEAQSAELELARSAKDAAWAAVGLAKEASLRANLAITIASVAAAVAISSAAIAAAVFYLNH
jgi:hypothetical protein